MSRELFRPFTVNLYGTGCVPRPHCKEPHMKRSIVFVVAAALAACTHPPPEAKPAAGIDVKPTLPARIELAGTKVSETRNGPWVVRTAGRVLDGSGSAEGAPGTPPRAMLLGGAPAAARSHSTRAASSSSSSTEAPPRPRPRTASAARSRATTSTTSFSSRSGTRSRSGEGRKRDRPPAGVPRTKSHARGTPRTAATLVGSQVPRYALPSERIASKELA